MSDIEFLQAEYCKLRAKGLDPKTSLSRLRAEIVGLELSEREKLLEQLRLWELSNSATEVKPSSTSATPDTLPIKPLQTLQMPKADMEAAKAPPIPAWEPPSATKVTCPHCGKPNDLSEVFCYSCGQLLTPERSLFETRHFDDESQESSSDEIFGPEATLVIVIKDTQEHYRIRPQDKRHEIVIGRASGGTMKPDIDLSPHKADELGVSRMHVSISYNERHRALSVMDMGSANGTFINGHRLHPEEKRVLRHGDELRLGKLALMVYFYRPKTAAP